VSKVKICFLILCKTAVKLKLAIYIPDPTATRLPWAQVFQSEFINKEMFETSIFSINSTLIFLSLPPKFENGING
jgi:hypothetical protein